MIGFERPTKEYLESIKVGDVIFYETYGGGVSRKNLVYAAKVTGVTKTLIKTEKYRFSRSRGSTPGESSFMGTRRSIITEEEYAARQYDTVLEQIKIRYTMAKDEIPPIDGDIEKLEAVFREMKQMMKSYADNKEKSLG